MVQPVQKNPLIGSIAVLQSKPGKEEAFDILKRIAHEVSYLMKEENFKVKQLVEFYPKDRSLLGMNVNRGMKIMLRLRDPLDEYRFLPFEHILGTMLHELTHNLFGPHDQKFYTKLDELSGRQWTIEQLGLYNSFIGPGHRLGGGTVGNNVRGTKLNLGANKIAKRGKPRGRKLGGLNSATGRLGPRKSAREMAAMAAEKRASDNKTCGNSQKQEQYIPSQDDLVIEILDDEPESPKDSNVQKPIEIIDLT